MVRARIAADDTLLETLDVLGGQTFAPELDTTLPPHLVDKCTGRSVVVGLVVLSVNVVGITGLGKSGQELDAARLVLATGGFSLDEVHLFNAHQGNSHRETDVLVVLTGCTAGCAELEVGSTVRVAVADIGAINPVRMIGISLKGNERVLFRHLVNGEIGKALLAEVGRRDGLVKVTVDVDRTTIVGSIAATGGLRIDFHNHPGAPGGVSVVVLDTRVVGLESQGEHPGSIRRVEAGGSVGVGGLVHQRIACLGLLSIFFSLVPGSHQQVSAGFDAIHAGDVRGEFVLALDTGQILLCKVKIGDDLGEHVLVRETGILV